jgi:DNA-binding response OmpR family regulator
MKSANNILLDEFEIIKPIPGPRRKILIVDDQSELRKLYDIILRYDFEVDEASNAIMALEKIIVDRPCCVLLDIRMPGRMSGLHLCRHIKDNASFRQTKIVIVTGSNQEFDRSMANDFGADGYFEKPVSPIELVEFLRQILV